jgi:uncharacterized BrkB/YihY/UPF0761 family membrane protein
MRRFWVLVTVVVLMTAMLMASVAPAMAVVAAHRHPVGPAWGVPVSTAACETVAGVGGFEWRGGGDVCWLNLPVAPP